MIRLKIVTNLISILFFIGLVTGCKTPPKKKKEDKEKINYILLIDLSDRVLKNRQHKQDINSIKLIWENFKERNKNDILNTEDIFHCVIAEQEKSPLINSTEIMFEDSLSINFSTMKRIERPKRKKTFSSNLTRQLTELYKKSRKDKKAENYSGANIQLFFIDDLKAYYKKGYKNYLFIITDGYPYVKGETEELPNKISFEQDKSLEFKDLNVCFLELAPKRKSWKDYSKMQCIWSNYLNNFKIQSTYFIKTGQQSLLQDLLSEKFEGEKYQINNFTCDNPDRFKTPTPKPISVNNTPKKKDPIFKKPKIEEIKEALTDDQLLMVSLTNLNSLREGKNYEENLKKIKKILEGSFPTIDNPIYPLVCSSGLIKEFRKSKIECSDLSQKFKNMCP
jgi:hypothetical protein